MGLSTICDSKNRIGYAFCDLFYYFCQLDQIPKENNFLDEGFIVAYGFSDFFI